MKISSRQFIIFYCIYSFAIKFLMLPQLLAQGAGADCWIAAAIGTVIELAVIYIALQVMTESKDSDIYSELRRNTKCVGAKIIIAFMLAFFALQMFILIKHAFFLLNDHMFENLNPKTFAVPILLLGIFFCFMQARSIFRSGEIFYIFIIVGIFLAVLPAVGQVRPSEVLPVMDKGVGRIFNTVFRNLIYFESASFLLMFSGDVKIEPNFKRNFMTVAVIAGVFFTMFIFMFYSLFGPLATTKDIAVSNFTLYASYLTQSGRLDWVLISIWGLFLILRFGVTFYCAFACLRYITNVKHRAGFISVPLAVFIYLMSAFVFSGKESLDKFVRASSWVIAAVYVLIPVLFLVCTMINKKRYKEGRHV